MGDSRFESDEAISAHGGVRAVLYTYDGAVFYVVLQRCLSNIVARNRACIPNSADEQQWFTLRFTQARFAHANVFLFFATT